MFFFIIVLSIYESFCIAPSSYLSDCLINSDNPSYYLFGNSFDQDFFLFAPLNFPNDTSSSLLLSSSDIFSSLLLDELMSPENEVQTSFQRKRVSPPSNEDFQEPLSKVPKIHNSKNFLKRKSTEQNGTHSSSQPKKIKNKGQTQIDSSCSYTCIICLLPFENQTLFENHIQNIHNYPDFTYHTHYLDIKFDCPLCYKSYARNENFIQHLKTKHKGKFQTNPYYRQLAQKKIFKCIYCPDSYKDARTLTSHLQDKHTSIYRQDCALYKKLSDTIDTSTIKGYKPPYDSITRLLIQNTLQPPTDLSSSRLELAPYLESSKEPLLVRNILLLKNILNSYA